MEVPPSGKTFIQDLHSFSRFNGGAFLFVWMYFSAEMELKKNSFYMRNM